MNPQDICILYYVIHFFSTFEGEICVQSILWESCIDVYLFLFLLFALLSLDLRGKLLKVIR